MRRRTTACRILKVRRGCRVDAHSTTHLSLSENEGQGWAGADSRGWVAQAWPALVNMCCLKCCLC